MLASDPKKNNLAWAATVAELVPGIALVVGLWLRWTPGLLGRFFQHHARDPSGDRPPGCPL